MIQVLASEASDRASTVGVIVIVGLVLVGFLAIFALGEAAMARFWEWLKLFRERHLFVNEATIFITGGAVVALGFIVSSWAIAIIGLVILFSCGA